MEKITVPLAAKTNFLGLTAAGGNSRAARKARAALQWRDRFGRFIEMGRGIKFKVRLAGGDAAGVSVHGKFVGAVGADKPNLGQVYVQNDPNGLKDGFYQVESANGAQVVATLSPDALDRAGIVLGKHADGRDIGARVGADIQDADSIVFSDSPIGWTKTANVWETDDKEFSVMRNTDEAKILAGQHYKLIKNGEGIGNFEDWDDVLSHLRELDGTEGDATPDGPSKPPTNATPAAPAEPEDTPELDALGEPIPGDMAGLVARQKSLDRMADRPNSPRFEDTLAALDQINARIEELKADPSLEKAPVAKIPEPEAPAAPEAPATPEAPVEPAADVVEPATPEAPAEPEAPATPEVDIMAPGSYVKDTANGQMYKIVGPTKVAGTHAANRIRPNGSIATTNTFIKDTDMVALPDADIPAPPATDNTPAGEQITRKAVDLQPGDVVENRGGHLDKGTVIKTSKPTKAGIMKVTYTDDNGDTVTQIIKSDSKFKVTPAAPEADKLDGTQEGDSNGGADAQPGGESRVPEAVVNAVPGVHGLERRGDSLYDSDGRVVATVVPRPARLNELDAQGFPTPDLFEISPENAQLFHDAISESKKNNVHSASVYVYPVDDYKNMRLFLTEDGMGGIALKDGDDMVSGFMHPKSKNKGAVRSFVAQGIALGGRRGDAFDTVLPQFYTPEGLVPVARIKWDDNEAPDGWDHALYEKYNGGRPDVVFMAYDPSRIDTPYVPGEGENAESYDAALAIQAARAEAPKAPEITPLDSDVLTGDAVAVGKRIKDARGVEYEVTRPGMINFVPNEYFVFGKRVQKDGTLAGRATRVPTRGATAVDAAPDAPEAVALLPEDVPVEAPAPVATFTEGDRVTWDGPGGRVKYTGTVVGPYAGQNAQPGDYTVAYDKPPKGAPNRIMVRNGGLTLAEIPAPDEVQAPMPSNRVRLTSVADETAVDGEPVDAAAVTDLGDESSADLPQDLPVAPGTRPDSSFADSVEDYADEKFMPTDEQRGIISAALSGVKRVVVQALAGSGKTSTLILIAKQFNKKFPDKKIGYVAFNKAIQVEAEGRMPNNTQSRTGDSLAFGALTTALKNKFNAGEGKPTAIADMLGITKIGDDSAVDNVRALQKVINNYTISEDDTISEKHFEEGDIQFTPQALAWANAMWADHISPTGKLRFSNNHATKMWALTRPDLSKSGTGFNAPVDVIFFDEAQDINPVMARVIRDQTVQVIYVGDSRQAIYAFRGAEDELDNVVADVTLPLTKSFRFGQNIAGFGNRFLSLLKSPYKIIGAGPEGNVVGRGTMRDADAILVRSNAGAIRAILNELAAGRVVGVSSKYKADLDSVVRTAAYLKQGGAKPAKLHDDLRQFADWSELEKLVKDEKASAKEKMYFNIVEKHGIEELEDMISNLETRKPGEKAGGASITGEDGTSGALGSDVEYSIADGMIKLGGKAFDAKHIIKAHGFKWNPAPAKFWGLKGGTPESRANALKDLNRALGGGDNAQRDVDVVVTTAHQAKGLEWDNVKIGDDFRGPVTTIDDDGVPHTVFPSPEEMRLAYVAVTRAVKNLDPGALAWVLDHTDAADESPDEESKGLPNATNPDAPEEASEAPEAAPEPAPEATLPLPEPEPTEIIPAPPTLPLPEPEPTPEPIPAPEVEAPQESYENPAPSPTPAPEPSPEADPTTGPSLTQPDGAPVSAEQISEALPGSTVSYVFEDIAPSFIKVEDGTWNLMGTDIFVPEEYLTSQVDTREIRSGHAEALSAPAPEETPEVPAEAPVEAPVSSRKPFKLRFRKDPFKAQMDYLDGNGKPVGGIELTPNGTYDATFMPDDSDKRQVAVFDNEDDAATWLGDLIAKEHGLDTNPINKKPVGKVAGRHAKPATGNEKKAPRAHAGRHAKPANEAHIAKAKISLESKNVEPERRAEILDLLDKEGVVEGEVADVEAELSTIDNLPSGANKPRPNAPAARSNQSMIQAEKEDPNKITDPNLIMLAIKKANPGFKTMANGDLVLETRTVGHLTYDVMVRRTAREQFPVFIRETNTLTGEARVTKIRQNDQHSYFALDKKVAAASVIINKPSPDKWFKQRPKDKVELIPESDKGQWTTKRDALDDLMDGKVAPRTMDEAADAVYEAIEAAISRGMLNKPALENIAKAFKLSDKFVERTIAAVNEQIARDAAEYVRPAIEDPWVAYGGEIVRVGDWVDWTEHDTKSPYYGRVFRGRVHRHLDLAVGGEGRNYGYTDNVEVWFPELNRLLKTKKPGIKRMRTARNLAVVSDEHAAPTPPFYAKVEELAMAEKLVGAFGVPSDDRGNTPRPLSASRVIPPESVALPFDKVDIAIDVSYAQPVSKPASEIVPGDIVMGFGAGDISYAKVVESVPAADGGHVVTSVAPDADGNMVEKASTFPAADPKVMVFSPGTASAAVYGDRADWDMEPALPAQIRKLGQLMNRKVLSKKTRLQAEEAFEKWDLTRGEVVDLIAELETRMTLPIFDSVEPLSDLLQRLADAMKAQPDVDSQSMQSAANAAVQMQSLPLPLPAPDPSVGLYDGYDIKKISYDGVKFDGKNAPFKNMNVVAAQVRVGDIVPDGVGTNRVYQQVLEITPDGRFKVRVIAKQGGQRDYLHGAIRTVRLYKDSYTKKIANLKRPTEHIAADYNKGVVQGEQVVPVTGGAFGQRAAEMRAEFMKPGIVKRVMSFAQGAMNIFAQVDRMGNGVEVFHKGVNNVRWRQFHNPRAEQDSEILANRVAFELGIEDVVLIGLPNNEVVSTLVQGRLAGDVYDKEKAIMANFADYPNARLIGLLDFITNNHDRHNQNWMIDNNGQPVPIDHGNVGWGDQGDGFYSPFPELALGSMVKNGVGKPLFTYGELMAYRDKLKNLDGYFDALGRSTWLTNVIKQLDRVISEVK